MKNVQITPEIAATLTATTNALGRYFATTMGNARMLEADAEATPSAFDFRKFKEQARISLAMCEVISGAIGLIALAQREAMIMTTSGVYHDSAKRAFDNIKEAQSRILKQAEAFWGADFIEVVDVMGEAAKEFRVLVDWTRNNE